MTFNRRKGSDMDQQFEKLYRSVVRQNQSWPDRSRDLLTKKASICDRASSFNLSKPSGAQTLGHHQGLPSATLLSSGTVFVDVQRSREKPKRGSTPWCHRSEDFNIWRLEDNPERKPVSRTRGGCEKKVFAGSRGTICVSSDEETVLDLNEWFPDEKDQNCISLFGEEQDSSPGVVLVDDRFCIPDDVVCVQENKDEAKRAKEDTVILDNDDRMSWHSAEDQGHAGLCQSCTALFTKMQGRRRNCKKSIESNPASLSCDQWMLMKRRPQNSLLSTRGKLWNSLKYIKKQAEIRGCSELCGKPVESCSRPSLFLQRNLSRCKIMEAHTRSKADRKRRLAASSPKQKEARPFRKQKVKPYKTNTQNGATGTEDDVVLWETGSCRPRDTAGKNASIVLQDSGDDADRARRRLSFDLSMQAAGQTEPKVGGRRTPGTAQSSRAHVKQRSEGRRKGSALTTPQYKDYSSHFSWLQNGGFKSMLANLDTKRTTVVIEEDHPSASEDIFCLRRI
ncbi:uncharacterized protein LOC136711402 [Amia ocellicauda]|uniref:uncharacterized protein LOC136711402 n=1 Tax=Amia ocellicauda TaxID=2972642 RepID=UPI0034639ABB